jgi:hypothetical protein
MGTSSQPGIYNPETLVMLCCVLDESFRTITDAGRVPDEWRDELRVHLAQVIITVFDRGVHDPLVLRRVAVDAVGLTYTGSTVIH